MCENEREKQQGARLRDKVKSCSLFSMSTLDPYFIYLSNLLLFNRGLFPRKHIEESHLSLSFSFEGCDQGDEL